MELVIVIKVIMDQELLVEALIVVLQLWSINILHNTEHLLNNEVYHMRQTMDIVKKQPSQDVLHGDKAEEELGLAHLVSSYTLPHQNSQPGERGRQMARSKVLSRRARDM